MVGERIGGIKKCHVNKEGTSYVILIGKHDIGLFSSSLLFLIRNLIFKKGVSQNLLLHCVLYKN